MTRIWIMRIPIEVYKVFYNKLTDQYREDNLTEQDLKANRCKLRSAKIWEIVLPGEILPRSAKIIGIHSTVYTIFYDIQCLGSAKEGDMHAKIKDALLISALEYLRCELPANFADKILDEDYKAKILFQIFLQNDNERKKYLSKYAKLIVFEDDSSVLKEEGELSETEVQNPEKTYVDNFRTARRFNTVEECINGFFEAINNSHFYEASRIVISRSGLFADNTYEFRMSYTWTSSIHTIHIFNVEYDGDNGVCNVYCEEDIDLIDAFNVLNLGIINNSTMGEFYKIIQLSRKDSLLGYCRSEDLGIDTTCALGWLHACERKMNQSKHNFLLEKSKYVKSAFKNLYRFTVKRDLNSWWITYMDLVKPY